MDKFKQIIAIAEECGWTFESGGYVKNPSGEVICYTDSNGGFPIDTEYFYKWLPTNINYLPKYLTDLNAMHEAELILGAKQRGKYFAMLNSACGFAVDTCMASAKIRAEAFLRTIGKWEDDK